MFSNPIAYRELVGLLRERRTMIMLISVTVLFALLVLVRWPSDSVVDLSGSQAREVFAVFAYGLLVAVTLLVPVFPATTIVREKQSGTLALLLNSTLGKNAIYFGKLTGALGFILGLMLVSVPSVTACYVMGGVSLVDEVLMLYLILMIASLQYATFGLFVSTLTGSSDSALRWTFGGVLGLSVLTIAPYWFLQGSENIFGELSNYLRNFSPIPAVTQIVGHSEVGSQGIVVKANLKIGFIVCGIFSSIVFALCTLNRLDWSLFDQARSQGRITDERKTSAKVWRRIMFLVDPQRRKSGIAPFFNPVMVKEFRCRQFGRFHWLMRLVAGCALVSLTLAYAATLGSEEWGVETIGALIVTLQVVLIVILTPGLAAGLISTERESGGWDLLRATPMSASKILRGKLMSVVWTLALILAATLPGYGVMIWIKPVLQQQVIEVLICLVVTSIFTVLLSATVSSFFEKTASASVTTYLILIVVWAGSLLVWLGRDAPFGFTTVENVLRINPMAAALRTIEAPGFEKYDLVPSNWWVMGISSFVLLCILTWQTVRLTRPR
jgi:ABC-type transport system involved in multi-copper enzyme maturation permease subunit